MKSSDQSSSCTNQENMDRETKSLDISVAFPQATPASIFPPSVSDYYQLYELFTPEEQAIGKIVRDFMETEVAPIMSKYWEKAEFPVQLIPKLAALHIAGGTVKGYGCSGLSMGANAIAAIETARVDASFTTFVGVHAHLAVRAIGLFGSEAQKQKYLPSLAEFKTIACWAMTEPDHGSNITTLKTTARKVEGGWILEGQKRWIGNGTLADIMIVCAKNIETNQLNGFIVKKGTPGLQATKIENKIGLRITQNADILLRNVFVPDEDKLPGVNSARDFIKVLPFMRTMICWQAVGISMGAYDMCHRYLRERQQFGAPLAAFQINQEKLVRMLGNIQAMFLLAWRITTLIESGNITVGRVSMCKAWVTLRGRENVSLARELLGGNGIVSDFHVSKAFCDMEALYTYEGTYDLTTLTTGKEVTGISSLRPPPSSKCSRL